MSLWDKIFSLGHFLFSKKVKKSKIFKKAIKKQVKKSVKKAIKKQVKKDIKKRKEKPVIPQVKKSRLVRRRVKAVGGYYIVSSQYYDVRGLEEQEILSFILSIQRVKKNRFIRAILTTEVIVTNYDDGGNYKSIDAYSTKSYHMGSGKELYEDLIDKVQRYKVYTVFVRYLGLIIETRPIRTKVINDTKLSKSKKTKQGRSKKTRSIRYRKSSSISARKH